MNKKIFIILGLGLILTSTIAQAEKIRFATAIHPPFVTLDANQELQGFDIDIAKALCKKINAECSFSNEQFSNMILSLQAKKYDAWISAITIDKERQQKDLTFSDPYFSSTIQLIATKATVFNAAPAEIKGKTIGVEDTTCYIPLLKSTYGDTIKIKIFSTKNEAYSALENGSIDAVIDDNVVLKHWRSLQKEKPKYRLINLPAKYPKLVWHKYGIAIAKDNLELIKKLNHAIGRIKSDGTYNKLVKKYFANY